MLHKGQRKTKPDKRPVSVAINRSFVISEKAVTNAWITSPWTNLITNFLILTCKDAMEIGCSLSLSFLKFLKFAHTLISSEYCSRKLKCALCAMWVSVCYPIPDLLGVWNVSLFNAKAQSLHGCFRGQPSEERKREGRRAYLDQ